MSLFCFELGAQCLDEKHRALPLIPWIVPRALSGRFVGHPVVWRVSRLRKYGLKTVNLPKILAFKIGLKLWETLVVGQISSFIELIPNINRCESKTPSKISLNRRNVFRISYEGVPIPYNYRKILKLSTIG